MADMASLTTSLTNAVGPQAGEKALFAVGSGIDIGSKLAAGMNAQSAGEAQARSLKQQAAEELATGVRDGREKRKEMEKVISRQRAVAAASGAGVSNPTILDLIGDTAQRGEFLAQDEVAKGKARAAGLKDKAKLATWSGGNAMTGSIFDAVGTAAGDIYKYDKRYG